MRFGEQTVQINLFRSFQGASKSALDGSNEQDVISQSIWLGKRGFQSTTLKILMGELFQCIDFAGHIKNFYK